MTIKEQGTIKHMNHIHAMNNNILINRKEEKILINGKEEKNRRHSYIPLA